LSSQAGELERARDLWFEESSRRRDLRVPVHADAIRVGEAFLRQARAYASEGRLTEAADAADRAQACGHVAAADLMIYGEPTGPGDELFKRAVSFKASLSEPASN